MICLTFRSRRRAAVRLANVVGSKGGIDLHRTGIFRSSVLVDIVNCAGLPFLAIYFFAMFTFPWIDGQGSWAHVQVVWDRWQTLNAGALAFSASLIAFNISRFNETVQRERDFIAAKAFLPSTLSSLMEYFSRSAHFYEVLWEANGNAPAPLSPPDLPEGYREVFSNCIRHAEPQIGSYLSNILVHLQVHDARLRDAVAHSMNGDWHATDRYTLITYLYRLGELYALIGNLFGYARNEDAFKSRKLNWEDFRSAYSVLDLEVDEIFVDDDMNLQAFTQRALARAGQSQDA